MPDCRLQAGAAQSAETLPAAEKYAGRCEKFRELLVGRRRRSVVDRQAELFDAVTNLIAVQAEQGGGLGLVAS